MQARDFENFGYDQLYVLFAALKGTTYIQTLLTQAYDEIGGSVTGMIAEDISRYMEIGPADDEMTDLQGVFWTRFSGVPRLSRKPRGIVPSATRSLKRDLGKRIFIGYPRILAQDPNDAGNRPTAARIMQTVIDDNVSLLDMANMAYRPRQNGFKLRDTELEVVYDIRGHANLQQDANDLFAVFHFHTKGIGTGNGV